MPFWGRRRIRPRTGRLASWKFDRDDICLPVSHWWIFALYLERKSKNYISLPFDHLPGDGVIFQLQPQAKLLPQLVFLPEHSHQSRLQWSQVLSELTHFLLKNLFLPLQLPFYLLQLSDNLHCFSSLCTHSFGVSSHDFYLISPQLGISVQLLGPFRTWLLQLFRGEGHVENILLIRSCIEQISMHGWKHKIDDLFECIVQVCLSLPRIGSDSILHELSDTWTRSKSRLMRSMSGSSEFRCFSSSPKV